ncbi:hypothetical protein IFM89_012015, partial [Coptis chinensis]
SRQPRNTFYFSNTANEIMSKIEEAAKPLGFNVHKNNYKVKRCILIWYIDKDAPQMKLKGDKTGRKGHLSVATEVSVTIDGCQEKILPFSGRSGLYIEGSVSPPISGVDIRVVTADNSGDAPLQKGELVLETTTEPDGFFIGGPLYDDADYEIEASKISKPSPSSVDVVWGLGSMHPFISCLDFIYDVGC